MNHDEAKAILTVWREMDDPAEIPGLQEALSLAESDPDLKAWFTKEREFDDHVASVVSDVQVPSDLRDRILSSLGNTTKEHPTEPSKKRPLLYFPKLLPLAASLVIVFFVSLLLFGPPSVDADTALNEFTGHIGSYTKASPGPTIASKDYEVIRQHLASAGAVAPPRLSAQLADLVPTGAGTTEWNGIILGIIHLENNQSAELRLFIVATKEFPEPETLPPTPTVREEEGIHVLIWTETDYLYGLSSGNAHADLSGYLSE